MEEVQNSAIFLRPRFQLEIAQSSTVVLEEFSKVLKEKSCEYPSKFSDGHVAIDVPVKQAHFWSPQLNVEVISVTDSSCLIKGLFGPKPQVWTLFMFVHFVLGFLFLCFAVVLYVRVRLGEAYIMPLMLLIFIPLLWILLYFLGRIGKGTGQPQMEDLHQLLIKIIEKA
ncbi:hypothetical protein GCM10011416_04440 [Polaribacter pacificus]|uniref:GTP-binding protein n=1 Tax=Polaribacter pacificus TaxID=1775173 RepID=A0A917MBZ0_9FLAO|nr:GTP-binding protein [Polaribacter pacificus]GGG91023.1 hypothetical protein GCM10011416_04440 [Polaribacter pacificus]